MSGSVALATSGKLTLMVGGVVTDLERARPVLDGLAATILCRRSFMRCVRPTAMSAGNFCVDGAPCEITCMSMPTSSISLMRSGPKS